MKTAIDSYGGVKGCHAAVVKIQESNQTMTEIQALNNFSFESAGLRVWRVYNWCGPCNAFHTKTGEAIWFALGAYRSASPAAL